ncbi:hypothetical protein HGRIS_004536 [Hohenbuehelia grisea]|uniref:Uncharacterized protein n=1 Tax=Hohenbuehelia grisea TaxID=104357 RepID=A0ABR3JCJ2_9AGAR
MRTPGAPNAPSLTIIPPHPPLIRRRSSLMSVSSLSPCTPRSCRSPASSFFLSTAAKRKSTDSWNSSIGPDDFETEWKPEQARLLMRTLDALPAHLVTPFNGPVPPANLLDKIARGVAHAKGPVEWPHSTRATRVKLIELARARAKDDAAIGLGLELGDFGPDVVEHLGNTFDGDPHMREPEVLKLATNIQRKRPLYRQSSMDFINAELKDGERVPGRSRLPAYHPYTRGLRSRNRSPSPPRADAVPSLLNPSTPSSSTLNTLSSFSGGYSPNLRTRALRRSVSTLSTLSTGSSNSGKLCLDPRIERVKLGSPLLMAMRTPPLLPATLPSTPVMSSRVLSPGAFGTPSTPVTQSAFPFPCTPGTEPPPTPQTRKRASKRTPSISTLSQSSDEEEKARARSAKKARTRRGHGDAPASPSPMPARESTPGAVREKPSSAKKVAKPIAKTKAKVAAPAAPCPGPCDVEMKDVCTVRATHHRKGSGDSARSRSASLCPDPAKLGATVKVGSVEKAAKGDGKSASLGQTLGTGRPSRPRPMNVQRNPSILGAELLNVGAAVSSPPPLAPTRQETRAHAHTRSHSGGTEASVASSSTRPVLATSQVRSQPRSMPNGQRPQVHGQPPQAPAQPDTKVRTLRRVRRLPGRIISFSNLRGGLCVPEESDMADDEDHDESLSTPIRLR